MIINVLDIKDLSVKISDKYVIKNLSLTIKLGESHVIMGPNGTGKTTLMNSILSNTIYNITNGTIKFLGKLINNLPTDLISKRGIFMSFQNPIEIPGVTWNNFLQTSLNSINSKIKKFSYIKDIISISSLLYINDKFLQRDVNVGFSGGEKKKLELLQMLLLKPKLIILDEIDSGLDIDSIKIISLNINKYCINNNVSLIIITHYNRILEYIPIDFVHIFTKKRITCSGNINLSNFIEKYGYNFFLL